MLAVYDDICLILSVFLFRRLANRDGTYCDAAREYSNPLSRGDRNLLIGSACKPFFPWRQMDERTPSISRFCGLEARKEMITEDVRSWGNLHLEDTNGTK